MSASGQAEVAQPEWHVGSALNSGHAATASACRFRAKTETGNQDHGSFDQLVGLNLQ